MPQRSARTPPRGPDRCRCRGKPGSALNVLRGVCPQDRQYTRKPKEHRMPVLARLMALITTLGLIGGCATAPTKATFEQYASPPVDSFTYLGRYNGVRILDGNNFVLWTTVNDAYLIKVMDPCPNLAFANKVDLTSASNTVTSSVDWD